MKIALHAGLILLLSSPALQGSERWKRLAPHFLPPEGLVSDPGTYRSPLVFDDGRAVKTPEDWRRRREEIRRHWHSLLGAWPPLLERPRMETLVEERRGPLTQRKVRVEAAADLDLEGYLLLPDGAGPFPAVLVVFYDPETGAGLNPKRELLDFGYQLALRGFVALSIGWPREYTEAKSPSLQPLSSLAYLAANCRRALAGLPGVDPARIGICGHSFGGKWALFAAALGDDFACGAWSDPGIVFDETRPNVNYWEPWYLGWEAERTRKPGVPTPENPRTGPYRKLIEEGRDLHEFLALLAPRPFLVSGGSEDPPERWKALHHAVAVNRLLGHEDRVAMTNRPGHPPTAESNEALYLFFEHFLGQGAMERGAASLYSRWENGPPRDEGYFPIAVWVQSPRNAARYKEAGINLYVGLWKGPTEEHLETLRKAGMPVICAQNQVGLAHRSDPIIIGWMHGDEPDNAQSLGQGKGYGPPVLPERIVADHQHLRAADPTRPVLLNLGQGVAWDRWHGRGVRTNHPEDYPEYVKGGDIVSFDIYPAVHDHPEVKGNLWYVARGVDRLVQWTEGRKAVWNCIECTRISNTTVKPTPHQVRAEVWLSLVHGSRGIIYFVHQFKPDFVEAGLLADPEMLAAVTGINREIRELAPVLNSPTVKEGASARSSEEAPIDVMLKRQGGATYLFAAGARNIATGAAFEVKGLPPRAEAEVLGENRRIPVVDGRFEDRFGPYQVHLYRIREGATASGFRFRHHFVSRELPMGQNGSGDYGLTALADLDRDGDLDFVLGGRSVKPARLYWFEFQAPDRWVEHRVGADYRSDVGLAALDVDGDGWKDLVASGVWFRNPRRPREAEFERHVFDPTAGGAHDIVAHDLDGDGRLDVAMMGDERTGLDSLSWFSIPSDPTKLWERNRIGPGIHGAITPGGIADLDGDGDADVLRGDAWFENRDGKGREWIPHPDIPFGRVGPFGKCVRTAVADLDGDGRAEIVMSDADIVDSRVAILRRGGGEGGWSKQELPRSFAYGSLHSLAVADLNGDGRPDIAVNEQEELLPAGRANPRWVVWENLGDGKFAERIILDQKLGGHELQSGDVDGDGDIDLCSKPWGARPDNGAGGKIHVDFLENLPRKR